jgi:protein-S-isoprenylcysteine O-methyltransferase Ste14
MTWQPIIKAGLWNAWILMLIFVLHPLIMIIVDQAAGTGGIFKKMGDVPTEDREKRNNFIAMLILFLLVGFSIFLPLKTATAWFYAGLAIWLAGLVIFLIAIVNVATTPMDQVFKKGIYRISRHPLYISMSACLCGVSVASASWIFLLLSVVYIVLLNSQAEAEERSCFEKYGDEYKEYMSRTPRWIGIPK